jgi:hypothetical protein
MANRSRYIIAESKIKKYFSQDQRNVYSHEQIREIFDQKRMEWNLPQSMYVNQFIDKLVKRQILKLNELKFEGYLPQKERYTNENATVFQIAISLMPKSYLSHYSAVYLNGLTTQIPKTIYVTFEQSDKVIKKTYIEQSTIDSAFKKQQRISGATTVFEDYTILMHNGKNTGRAGVYVQNGIPITNIERTLIDITVRPNYAGGVFSILETYKKAIDNISINKLIAILDNINFIYPYYQSIGFYLERAGCEISKLEGLRKRKMQFDFYLTYDMQEMEYSKIWKLFYPKGL